MTTEILLIRHAPYVFVTHVIPALLSLCLSQWFAHGRERDRERNSTTLSTLANSSSIDSLRLLLTSGSVERNNAHATLNCSHVLAFVNVFIMMMVAWNTVRVHPTTSGSVSTFGECFRGHFLSRQVFVIIVTSRHG